MKKNSIKKASIPLIAIALLGIYNHYSDDINKAIFQENNQVKVETVSYNIDKIPDYEDKKIIELNNNEPQFTEEDYNTKEDEKYSELDDLGRCGVAFAKVGTNTMPTEKRGSIGMVKPSGWQTKKYNIVDGKYLYNRCHLIGYQLTGENANVKNLITCTRQMNAVSMLEYENKVAEYVKKTKNHVLYRVRPVFKGDNLVATGVTMEAKSIEDNGKGVSFNVFIYNVQGGIEIDYSNGNSKLK